MSRIRDHKLSAKYANGLDALAGDLGIGTFVPWLGALGSLAGGLTGGGGSQPSSQQQIQQALEAERQKQAAAKAAADAARARTITYVILGILGVGVAGLGAWAVFKK